MGGVYFSGGWPILLTIQVRENLLNQLGEAILVVLGENDLVQ
jgi:hypothetical protein